QNARQEARERLRPPDVERQGGTSCDFLILRRRVVADYAPEAQSLHQGRMSPPDFRGLNVNGGPGEQLPVPFSVDRARKKNAGIRLAAEGGDVIPGVGGVADDDEGNV